MPLWAHFVAVLFLVGFPLWDLWEARELKQASRPGAKSASYIRFILGLWITALLVLSVISLPELLVPPQDKIPFVPRFSSDAKTALVLGLVLGFVLQGIALLHPSTRKRLLAQCDAVDYLLPRTNAEMMLFAGVAVSAGICEEIIYRGFLIRYLQAAPFGLAVGSSLLLSAALFGLAHAGQGAKGMVSAALGGLLLGGIYVASGSLVLPILLHVAMDLRALAFAALRRSSRPAKC